VVAVAATGPQVGTAWIAVTPSFQGFASSITSDLSRTLARAGSNAGDAGGNAASDAFNNALRGAGDGATGDLTGELTRAGSTAGDAGGDAAGDAFNAALRTAGDGATADLTADLTQAGDAAGDAAGAAAGDSMNASLSDRMSGLQDSLSGPAAVAGGITAGAFGLGLANAMDTTAANARVAAGLGLTEQEAQRVGDVAGDVFVAGWGASMDEASQAVGTVGTSLVDLGNTTDAELTALSSKVLALADVFQWDLGEATTAASQLIANDLVKDSTEAFDVMTRAAQELPASMTADIPATITEYSEQFERLGLDAQSAFGLMSQYVQAGGKDIDQAADILHEFGRITTEETDRAAAGFAGVGLDADRMLGMLAEGGPAAEQALSMTLDALRGVDDPAQRAALSVELFGDMAGEANDALLGMDPATASLDNVAGAADGLTDALGQDPAAAFTTAMRLLTTTLGQALMPVLTTVGDFAAEHPTLFRTVALAVIAAAAAFTVMTAAIWAMNVALAANPVVWIILGVIAAMALLAAAVALVIVYWDEIVAATRAAWEWVRSAVATAVNWIVSAFLNFTLYGLIVKHWDSIVAATRTAWNWVKNFISGVAQGILNFFMRWTLYGLLLQYWDDILGAARGAFRNVREAITGALTGALDRVRDIGDDFISVGEDIVSGIVTGVSNKAGDLYDSLTDLASSALDAAKGWLGIGSPSRLFADEVGQWIPAGVEVGIADGEPALTRAIDHMVQVPEPPTVRATVTSGRAAAPAPVVEIVAGDRHLMAWLENVVRTRYGGDITRVGSAS
jgi:hypothetical protein